MPDVDFVAVVVVVVCVGVFISDDLGIVVVVGPKNTSFIFIINRLSNIVVVVYIDVVVVFILFLMLVLWLCLLLFLL